ncbi:hypothetical protein C922_02740 [Plasmodium inui San Antonio 1]|uniref:Origin recognition complex subunit 5 n=1 Tax=Plasmodium inui San Antonio 1 TaxID=1237626 RepID=W7A4T5_9APIC|nr:hypothetical protein C922_02740 [Plasmodium inui San Antonio 1]EUD66755.1 hypothetical protein C922_02740 [Plasmodium inui San Antonio 1]
MHKLANNESEINSDDCNETAQECIYGFSSPKKQRRSGSDDDDGEGDADCDTSANCSGGRRHAGQVQRDGPVQMSITGLQKNEQDCEPGGKNYAEEETNDEYTEESDYDEEAEEEDEAKRGSQKDGAIPHENDGVSNTSNASHASLDWNGSHDPGDDLYDAELNEMIDQEYFRELIPAIPHDTLLAYITCLKMFGFEREVQLHRLVNLLGDLRDPISVIQVLGLPGMGKTKVVKSFVKLKNVPFAYVNCLMALYQSGKSAKNVIYHTILKELSTNLLHEFQEYKQSNGFTNYTHDPTKLVPNHVSNTDVFFNVLHKLLSFRPEDGRGGGDATPGKKRRQGGKQNRGGVGGVNASEDPLNGMTPPNQHLQKDNLYDRSVVIILDNVRYLVRTHPDLFYALTRIHEYIRGPYNDMTKANKTTRGLCIILINRSPLPDEIFDGLPQPPTVWFDSYTADMCKNILYRRYNTMCFESLLTYNDKDLKIYCVKENKKEFLIKRNDVILDNEVICDIWCRYVDYIINVSYKDYKSDFHELLFICAHMWPLFIKPILEGTLEPIVENMNALQRNIDTHIRVATYNHASHFTFELIDSVFLNENNLKNKIDLSFYSRILLVGAYLASRNLPLTDKRFFNATVKGGAFTLPKKRKGRSKNESILTLIGQAIPKNFTFIRWICLTDCLLVCFFNEKLTLNSLICHQINTLIQLGFISFCSANNMSCLVRNSLMNGVQWSGYCGSALLNSTNNFSSLGNNIFSESANSVSYESLDPYTKLAIQVPEETIRSIARDLKIPLDELIL